MPNDRVTRAWSAAAIAIVAAALVLRLYDLDLKPLHHDEGVNGLLVTQLVQPPHEYHYRAANYHGPTLYYFGWLSISALGLTTVAIRVVPALFGVMAVCLMLSLRRSIGAAGSLAGAALLALSPGAVYFSRYFIHETLLVCFTLGIVASGARYHQTRRGVYLVLAALSAALMFATKETAIIAAGVLITATVGAMVWMLWRRGVPADGLSRRHVWWLVAAGAVFLLIDVALYTSFFTNPDGAREALRAFAIWEETGRKVHVHPWSAYAEWLARAELPLLLLGAIGAGLAIWRADHRFAVFAGLWAMGTIAAYSLIPYKTPWLALNMIVPLAISGGYVFQTIGRTGRMLIATVTLAISGYQTIALNFFRYDQEGQPYVYVHTRREVLGLVDRIRGISERAPAPVTIAVLSREQFPLSWYLRAYPAGYYGGIQPTADPIVIGSEKQERLLSRALGREYEQVGRYPLRPGVGLVLYVRRELLAATRP